MPLIVVKVANGKARKWNSDRTDYEESLQGHVWMVLYNGNSNPISIGFAPEDDEWPINPSGRVYYNDDNTYIDYLTVGVAEITQQQYEQLLAFAADPESFGFDKQYNALTNSCVDFTMKALEIIGFNYDGSEGVALPAANVDELRMMVGLPHNWGVSTITETALQSFAVVRQQRDPLVIDFDGDGIVEIENHVAPSVYFDFDNDNFAEAISWINPDDALLVRDVNGNGQIDNANELFGSSTLNGFTALAAINSNNDGVINSNDSAWNDLRVWPRDLLRPINLSHNDRLKTKDNWSHTNKNIRVFGLAVHKEPTNDNGVWLRTDSVFWAVKSNQQNKFNCKV